MEGQIRLRWTTHQGTILSVFDALLSSESLVDVTLACEGQYIRAHKVILSACSPYFQELLGLDASKHPIFFLKDVKYNELKALIQYMYRGEVNIAQEDLTSLLGVAQALKIRGLADVDTTSNTICSDTIILPDHGQMHRQKPSAPPAGVSVPIPPPPQVLIQTPSTSNPLNVPPPRKFHQTHSYAPPSINPVVSSPILAGVPPFGSASPPAAKKSRIETRQASQTGGQGPNQPRLMDPLINIQPLTTSQILEHTQIPTGQPSSNHPHQYEYNGQEQHEEYGGDLEEPEVYEIEEVKVEEIIGTTVEGDDREGEDNSMSRTSFSESWQMGEGDTSEVTDDDGQVPGGSGRKKEVGSGGGPVGGEGLTKKWACETCGRSYKRKEHLKRHKKNDCEQISEFKCLIPNCSFKTKWKHNLNGHLKKHTI